MFKLSKKNQNKYSKGTLLLASTSDTAAQTFRGTDPDSVIVYGEEEERGVSTTTSDHAAKILNGVLPSGEKRESHLILIDRTLTPPAVQEETDTVGCCSVKGCEIM